MPVLVAHVKKENIQQVLLFAKNACLDVVRVIMEVLVSNVNKEKLNMKMIKNKQVVLILVLEPMKIKMEFVI